MASNNKQDNSKKPTTQKQPRRRLFIILGIIVALALAGLAGWFLLGGKLNHQDQSQEDSFNAEEIYRQARNDVDNGDYDKAQKDLDIALEEASEEDQLFLLNAKFSVAWNAEKYEEAYLLAQKLCEVDESLNSYRWLAEASLKRGLVSEALTSFQKAQELIVGDDEQARYDRNDIQMKIDEIQEAQEGVNES